jgi:hypothetical protein
MDYPKSVPGVGLVGGKFVDENTATGQVGSLVPSSWGNAVTLELLKVIEDGGLLPDEYDNAQLSAAIKQLVLKGAVPFATKAEAEDGTNTAKVMSPLRVFQAIAQAAQLQVFTAFETTGPAAALVLEPVPAIAAYATPQRFRVKFSQSSTPTSTINVSGRGPKRLKQYGSAGEKVAATYAVDQLGDIEYDGTDFVLRDPLPLTVAADPWLYQPVGVPIAVFDNLAGVSQPPTNNSAYRYIKMTAADAYNTGVLTSESVTGSAPLVIATAVVSLSGSPINGQTVQLINTERRSLRAGNSGGIEADQGHGHRHSPLSPATTFIALNSVAGWTLPGPANGVGMSATTGDVVTDGTNGTPRIGNETRSKNIGVTYYMRVK